MDNYYSLLEVSLAASPDEIKKAYHRLAKVLHPDKNPNDANATASFQRLQRAYDILNDAQKRREYDLKCTEASNSRTTHYHHHHHHDRQTNHRNKTSQQHKSAPRAEQTPLERLVSLNKKLVHLETEQRDINIRIFGLVHSVEATSRLLKYLQEEGDGKVRKDSDEDNEMWWAYLSGPTASSTTSFGRRNLDAQKKWCQEDNLRRGAFKQTVEKRLNQQKADLQNLKKWHVDIVVKINVLRPEILMAQQHVDDAAREEARYRGKRRRDEEAHAEKKKTYAEHWGWEDTTKQNMAGAQEEAEGKTEKKHGDDDRRERARNEHERYRDHCRHELLWFKVGGPLVCQQCNISPAKGDASQCPGCGVVACGNCQRELQRRGRER